MSNNNHGYTGPGGSLFSAISEHSKRVAEESEARTQLERRGDALASVVLADATMPDEVRGLAERLGVSELVRQIWLSAYQAGWRAGAAKVSPQEVAGIRVQMETKEESDDAAVDQFAAMLKQKLARARAKGRSGWRDPAWSADDINRQMWAHAAKGDPLDVAAYAMFLALRGESTTTRMEMGK